MYYKVTRNEQINEINKKNITIGTFLDLICN